jgi:antitoxin Phd
MSKIRKKRISRSKKHRTWPLREAKARFSELVNEVIEDGCHTVTRNGHPVVVIISHKEFKNLKKPKNTLGDFLSESPCATFDLDIERDKTIDRDIYL